MNYELILVLIIVSLFGCKTNSEENIIILKDAEIIDIRTGGIETNSILIKENRIEMIASFDSFPVYEGATLIDCEGKYVVPGLFDMHMHIREHYNSEAYLKPLLLAGVTSIRDMGGYPDSIASIVANIKEGKIEGPNIYYAGYTLDGIKERDTPDLTTQIITNSTDLNPILANLNDHQVNFIKVHTYFPVTRIEELVEMANNLGLPVVGHIPLKMSPTDAILNGFQSIEHMNSLISALVYKEENEIKNITEAFYAMDSTYIDSLSNIMIQKNVALTPTLYILDKIYQSSEDESSRNIGKLMLGRFNAMVLQFQRNGVLILAGSDDPPTNNENINVIHDELKMLVDAGLSNIEALRSATINAASFLNIQNDYGSIDENKVADILILESNPLSDISNTMSIYKVLKSGKIIEKNH